MKLRAATLVALVLVGLTPSTVAAEPVPGTLLPAFGEYALDVEYGGPHTLLLALNGRIARLDTVSMQLTTVATAPVAHLAFDRTTGAVWFAGDGASVQRVAPDGAITTVVGDDDDPCFTGDCGDGGPASEARIGLYPRIGAAADGTLWIADGSHLRRVDPDEGTIDTVVDDVPFGDIAVAPDGRVAAVDSRRIAVVEDGAMRVLADLSSRPPCQRAEDPCGDGGSLADARFAGPINVAWSGSDLFVSESSSVVHRIRRIGADGRVTHVVGSFEGCGLQCRLGTPAATTAIGSAGDMAMVDGDLFFVDSSYVLRVNAIDDAPDVDPQGYRMIASDGGVFAFAWGGFHGSTGDLRLASPIVAGASNGVGGYWFVAGDGGVFTFGDAGFFGSAVGQTTSPVVDMARSPSGRGYWLLERNGRVHAFGDAPHRGNGTPPTATRSAAAILGARSGNGYRVVRTDGTQEDLQDQIGGQPADFPTLNQPIVHARPTPSGNGLWLVASDGGVFTQGDAGFFGSTGDRRLNAPVIDLVPTPSGLGYWLVAADGGVFTFGDARFQGSMGAVRLNRPVVAGIAGPEASG